MTYFFDKNGSLPYINPYAAYSIRRIYPNYTGPLLTIKRTSDSLTADLYADDYAKFTMIIISSGA